MPQQRTAFPAIQLRRPKETPRPTRGRGPRGKIKVCLHMVGHGGVPPLAKVGFLSSMGWVQREGVLATGRGAP
jgi:hypothetical protein